MASNDQLLQMGLPLLGAGVGFAYGGPAGASLGASAGGLVASGLGLMQPQQQEQGASASMRAIGAIQQNALTDLSNQQGMSPQAVSRLTQAQYGAENQALAMANVMGRRQLSPLEEQVVTKQIVDLIRSSERKTEAVQARMDPIAESERIKAVISGGGVVAQTQSAIDLADKQARERFEAKQQDRLEAFTRSTTALIQSIGTFASKIPKEATPEDAIDQLNETTFEAEVAEVEKEDIYNRYLDKWLDFKE